MEQFFCDGHLVRVNNETHEWCAIKVELTERDGKERLSITGMAGYWMRPAQAKKEAIEFWESFFAESKEEMGRMALEHGKRTPHTAAKFVVNSDGDYHGLDVVLGSAPDWKGTAKNDKRTAERVFTCHSCGQIREELDKWFPEMKKFYEWHLNDMKPACEHQEKLGWGHGRSVAMDVSSMTQVQRDTMSQIANEYATKRQTAFIMEKAKEIAASEQAAIKWMSSYEIVDPIATTLHEVAQVQAACMQIVKGSDIAPYVSYETKKKVRTRLHAQAMKECPPVSTDAWIFKDSIGAPCPECGYRYGTAWLYRELPKEVATWARAFITRGRTDDAEPQQTV